MAAEPFEILYCRRKYTMFVKSPIMSMLEFRTHLFSQKRREMVTAFLYSRFVRTLTMPLLLS